MSDQIIQRVQLINQGLDAIATIELFGDHLSVDTWAGTTVDVHHAGGRMPNDWHRGYQEALRDIAAKLIGTSPKAAAEWIVANAGDADTTRLGREAVRQMERWYEPPL